ncbi:MULTISPECIES: hypothetical protein [Janthinobacterium]|uniref:Uncharacterized protein n=1 Tax=Janthinobacterium kumbetense TaxID=2950280 RepID=A0ABT0WXN4_9BURK|nr:MULTISPECIES: hypothetical protein [Janthinobacterium]MCM2568797.1 hypothetical protein [Janthinobacterium kumbetense]MDN2675337.1 hypothetical protein [Janthinobacterium sp. SUN033]MDO8065935.1 hypothetical protein [Janthinobacterium sp. SUN206]MDO8072157.1 hypothetical protein [Janthinobacterium sp. SUN176]
MARSPHPKKDIEAALRHAENQGWRVEVGGSHAWGKIYCPYNDASCRCGEFCIACIWSTPKNPGNHAQAIRRVVDNCTFNKLIHDCMQRKSRG